ncbi:MAG: TIGR02391 family protein, partial [Methylocaldum sp.]|nr:TIGR02391 family protein [Methylocaldum sp.]
RNIHPRIEKVSKKLFDDGHYSQATFEAYKLIDREVQRLSKLSESGVKLMMRAFNEQSPLIPLTTLSNTSEKDEQEGYKFIFSGSIMAIRNPRGHEFGLSGRPIPIHFSLAANA